MTSSASEKHNHKHFLFNPLTAFRAPFFVIVRSTRCQGSRRVKYTRSSGNDGNVIGLINCSRQFHAVLNTG